MKANWIGHMLRRKYLLKHVAEGKVEKRIDATGRQGRRWKQILDDLKETSGYRKLKEETLDCLEWRTHLVEAVDLSKDGLGIDTQSNAYTR
jgi:hypothetical protein